MNNFKIEKEKHDKKYHEELEKTGIFWAFTNQQFEENKTHKKAPDNDYIRILPGGFIHKSNKKKFDNFINKIVPELNKEFTNKIDIKDLIKYELINRECFYTGEWQIIIPTIEYYLNNDISQRNDIYELVEIVYHECLKEENNENKY